MELPKKLVLPKLPFNYSDLEPCVSAKTIKTHYEGHHRNYVINYNKAIKTFDLTNLLFNYNGYLLHNFYWNSLHPNISFPQNRTQLKLVESGFTSKVEFDETLVEVCTNFKGSGWILVILDNNKIKIQTIQNNDLDAVTQPILLTIDAFEHAYYLDYTFNKKHHFSCIVKLLNWPYVESLL